MTGFPPQTPARNADAVGEALSREIAQLKEFVAVLQREQELLKHGDVDALLPLIETKNTLASALGGFAQARETVLAKLGLPSGRAGMDAWFGRPGQEAHRHQWETLLGLAAEARTLNEVNGKLIGMHMQHNQQAFTALMGAANRAMTYGPDGQQQTGLGGRILGKA